MSTDQLVLPSWRPGPARDALLQFLDAARELPAQARLACFDNDGTLWCERPTYVQYDFLVDALHRRIADDPRLRDRPEFAALLDGDTSTIEEIGLQRIALALTGLFAGTSADEFATEARGFLARARHSTLDRPRTACVYQPMLELIAALRRLDFTVAVITGGGTEFVRAISVDLYGVPPEAVVGTLIDYSYDRDDRGRPRLRRAATVHGDANEGAAKVAHIQRQLGRRPALAAGNSGGDREMLEWAAAGPDGVALALLVDHDDAIREFAYTSRAETFAEPEPITDVGARLGWTIVSMARDWEVVFGPM